MTPVRLEESGDEARIARALRRYQTYVSLRNFLILPFFGWMIIWFVFWFNTRGFWWAALATFVGFFVFALLLTWVVTLPLGYLLFGRDAMRVRHLAEDQRRPST
jgi:hypothetical protein